MESLTSVYICIVSISISLTLYKIHTFIAASQEVSRTEIISDFSDEKTEIEGSLTSHTGILQVNNTVRISTSEIFIKVWC